MSSSEKSECRLLARLMTSAEAIRPLPRRAMKRRPVLPLNLQLDPELRLSARYPPGRPHERTRCLSENPGTVLVIEDDPDGHQFLIAPFGL